MYGMDIWYLVVEEESIGLGMGLVVCDLFLVCLNG